VGRQAPCAVGINVGHDGGAALVTPDRMIAIGEERLNRSRYSPGWQASLLYCLRAAGMRLDEVDLFVASSIGMTPPEPGELGLHHLGVDLARVRAVDHHLAHAYSAYCLSPFETATVLVVDGAGNHRDTESHYAASPDGIELAGRNSSERIRASGIGATYEAFTNYLGWGDQEAGKTMALAAFGDPGAFGEPLFEVDGHQVSGRLRHIQARGVADLLERTGWDFGPQGSRGCDPRGADAAAWLQAETERAMCALAAAVVGRTGLPRLCMAGGVALNCVANERIRRLACVQELFMTPPASDRGQALGCALRGLHLLTGQVPRHPIRHDCFGRPYGDAEIEQALRRDPKSLLMERGRTPFAWRRERDIASTAAQMIADGAVIGWFQGGSELGPRALGGRSILADPRAVASLQTINKRIKHREPFRPFAPAVLGDRAESWFDLDVPSPFMLLAPAVRAERAARVPAVVHVDGTARVQTVDQSVTPRLAALLERLDRLTGVPMVLNTSFNDREPIVETPAHALASFQDTGLDALCIGDYLVEKIQA
jgi:carbamoyltransferase